MFFVIPEMPSKTFVMLYKKLPDHFKISSQDPLCMCKGKNKTAIDIYHWNALNRSNYLLHYTYIRDISDLPYNKSMMKTRV